MIFLIIYSLLNYLWDKYLWPNRKSKIKATNGIKYLGGWSKDIENNNPTFFGAFINNECIGVNSGHATSSIDYRSRGIYVRKEYRKDLI